jgi:transposase
VRYLCLLPEDARQRVYHLRDVFDGLRWIVRTGSPWRYLPKDFPPWPMVYQQSRRWLAAGCFETMVHDLRAILRFAAGRQPEATACIFDGRTMPSTVESGSRAGYDGYKRPKGSKVHMAVDTLGHLLAVHVTPADEQERDQVAVLSQEVQEVTGESVELSYVDQGYTGDDADADAASYGIHLVVVSLPEAKKEFVLLPKRWVVERSFGWTSQFRRLARDYERLSETLEGLHYFAFSILMLHKAAPHFTGVHNTL